MRSDVLLVGFASTDKPIKIQYSTRDPKGNAHAFTTAAAVVNESSFLSSHVVVLSYHHDLAKFAKNVRPS